MNLFDSNLMKRIGMGKMIGLIAGLIGFFTVPFVFTDVDMMLKIALLLWYITLGAIVGVFGVWDTIPVFNVKMPPCLRGMWVGAWMNFILALFIYDQLVVMMSGSMVDGWSPFRIILEGAVFGIVVDVMTTKYVGEGKKLLK